MFDFKKTIDDYYNMLIISVVALANKQKNNKIYDNFSKITIEYKQRFKYFLFNFFVNFDSTTIITNFNVSNNKYDYVLLIITNIKTFINNVTICVFFL